MNKFINVRETSIKWNLSERSVRNYCISNRVKGAIYIKGIWKIPVCSKKPCRMNEKFNKNYFLEKLREEKKIGQKGGVYHKLQIDMTYNSNHIEGNELTHDETRYIFETKTISTKDKIVKTDDIVETINHFKAIDRIIDFANYPLSEVFIKELHKILKNGTNFQLHNKFVIGNYKREPNMVGDIETTHPKLVAQEMKKIIHDYLKKNTHSFKEIIDFHVKFEKIHPFQDGNGRIGRLIAFKECLKNNIVPFIILDSKKMYYYRGLKKYDQEPGWLINTCLDGQDTIKKYLDYFNIKYH